MQICDVQPQLYIIKKAERQAERTSYFTHILFTIEHKNIQNVSTEKMHQFEKKKISFLNFMANIFISKRVCGGHNYLSNY